MVDRDNPLQPDRVTSSSAAPSVDGRHLSTNLDSSLFHAGASQPKRDDESRTKAADEGSASEASAESSLVQGACAPRIASATPAALRGTASTQSAAAAAPIALASTLRASAAAPPVSGTCGRVLRSSKAPATAGLAPSSAAGGSASVKIETASPSAEMRVISPLPSDSGLARPLSSSTALRACDSDSAALGMQADPTLQQVSNPPFDGSGALPPRVPAHQSGFPASRAEASVAYSPIAHAAPVPAPRSVRSVPSVSVPSLDASPLPITEAALDGIDLSRLHDLATHL